MYASPVSQADAGEERRMLGKAIGVEWVQPQATNIIYFLGNLEWPRQMHGQAETG